MTHLTRRHFGRALTAVSAGAVGAPMINGSAKAQAAKLVLSHHVPTTHLIQTVSEKFAGYVQEATKGQVTIDIKPASQLFNLRTSAEAIQLGTLDLCWSDLGTLGNWQPQFGFVALPFLFNDFDHVKKVLYGKVGEQVSAEVKATLGIEVLSLGASGFRVFLGRKEIKTANDVRGIKLRVPEIPVWIEMARALGANPTPIPAGEIYTALQTGVVDAMESPADFMTSNKMWEVAQFATRTHHIFTEVSMFASTRSTGMKALSPANLQAVRDAAKRAVQGDNWELNLKEQTAAWELLSSRTKATPNPEIASFREKMAPVLASFTNRAGAKGKAFVDGVVASA
ncbi:MAG: TRAP transporter substrate-binding protein [Alphaproteobacteria bacterium]|nr:TRAP transporter substrate-binding protein [Alphaproteobacteria bacterium]